jgi:hypothetical protein
MAECISCCVFVGKDYQREVKKGVPAFEVMVPTKVSLMACFKVHPDDSTVVQERMVSFFYHIAVATVEKRVLSSAMGHKDVWSLLGGKPVHWAAVMAYAMVLVEKLSDLQNIIHNTTYQEDSYKDHVASEEESAAPAKMMKRKKKMRSKTAQVTIVGLYYRYLEEFFAMQIGQENEDRAEARERVLGNRERFAAWEKKIGIIVSNKLPGIRKRRSVEPLQDISKKQLQDEAQTREAELLGKLAAMNGSDSDGIIGYFEI